MKPRSGPPDAPVLLLVEDDPNDQRLLRLALRDPSPRLSVDVAPEGESAVAYLARMLENGASRPRPFLVLSDIHLPGLSGWDLLAWVRARPEFDRLPVLLWTSLPNPEGKDRALRLGAAGYLGKPRDLNGYRRLAERVTRLLGD
ncbi:MAG TPA: response regulator [Planctomycetota bacterium]